MNILVSSSKKFFPYLTVMLESLYVQNPDCTISVYVMHYELDATHISILSQQAKLYGHTIVSVPVSTENLSWLPTQERWPHVLYLRLSAADILPKFVDRILSIDVDVIVRKPLLDLYNTELNDDYAAACPDFYVNTNRYKQHLGIPMERTYFNAGVMVINLKAMRTDGIGLHTFLDAARGMTNRLKSMDQDLLNLVFADRVTILDAAQYNCSPLLYDHRYRSESSKKEKFASIIHYMTDCKPWNSYLGDIGSDVGAIWWDFSKKTPFYEQLKEEFDQQVMGRTVREYQALQMYYTMLNNWMRIGDMGRRLEEYFLSRGYRTIALYGLNIFLELMCRELRTGPVHIAYLIDSYSQGIQTEGDSKGYEVKKGSHFEDIDVIIVTACAHFRAIRSGLDDSVPVISLDEIFREINSHYWEEQNYGII
ncbi:glycosyltransferase family 8 protein [Gorillibacterium sp. CAU 1737]|uniref:glycosyltransferase family 8 protein n=1 Tax=Gorillibacterium sp. CAU 1737 TaxID=3140362 RepID=UPI003260D905